jgi:hypothetical protein
MADTASRSFSIPCNTAFLTYFNHRFPLPQQQFWRLVPHMPKPISLVILTLDGKRLPLQQWMTASKPSIGNLGSNSAATHAVTPTCSTAPNQSNSNYSSVSLQGSGAATTAAELKSKLKLLKPRSATWRRPSCWMDTQTLVGPTDPKTSTCHSLDSSAATKPTTLPQNRNSPSP